ncbi:solute carrier family 53 member 1-like isoform X2 [Clavelina lepadiformis]
MLYDCKEEVPNVDVRTDENAVRLVAQFEEQFFGECDLQLTKVNTFFAEKVAEATRKFAMLQSELQAHKESLLAAHTANSKSLTLRRRVSRPHLLFQTQKHNVHIKTAKDLKLAYTEFYLSLILLQNYQELNFTGFRKILKKHDKMLNTDKGVVWRQNYVETAPFHKDSLISEYILKTETLYINDLENGDRSKAMKRLRVPPLTDTRTYPKGTVFRVGLFLGMFVMITVVAIIAAFFIDIYPVEPWLVVDLYRPGFMTFLFITFLGFNIWGWRTAGVNHVLIFEIDPRQHLSHQHFFEVSSILSILWGLSLTFLLFGNLEQFRELFPAYLNPGILYAVYVLFLINPFPVLFHKARFWLLKRLWRLVACGFYRVEFADFWLADQLNSLVQVLLDAEYIICFYILGNIWSGNGELGVCGSYSYGIRAVIGCYPAYIRFVQCIRRFYDSRKWFPHLVNAGKYSTTFFKVIFHALYTLHSEKTHDLRSVYFYMWLASCFVNSCYTLTWDIKMDWGFFDKNPGENKFLREEIVYPYKSLYYLAMVEDSAIRFSWIVTVAVQQSSTSQTTQKIVSTILVLLEAMRRFIWNFFRLENEHLNNCGEFRAVRDISVAPLRTDDLATLEKIMDEDNGAETFLLKRRVLQHELFAGESTIQSQTIKPKESSVLLYVGDQPPSDEGTSTSPL